MSDVKPRFPEYGDGGDCTGARRLRHAFRSCVAACVLFAGMLWFTEYFLRYDQAERLYLSAVTLPIPSARVLLQSAVKLDAERHAQAMPKYTVALAEREEEDEVLSTYADAYKMDANNPFLAIRYGCQLFLQDRFAEARERFREAGAQPPRNALPGYLEAAAAQWASPSADDLSESLALVARTNNSGDPMIFPLPSWPEGILPTDGDWYARLRRFAVDESCAPLYRYADFVLERAGQDIGRVSVEHWNAWLDTLAQMGQRLIESPDLGAIQAVAGITIQKRALEEMARVAKPEGAAPDDKTAERIERLDAAMARLTDFERTRDERIRENRDAYLFPLLRLCGLSFLILFGGYSVAFLAAKLSGSSRSMWTLRHSRLALTVFCGAPLLLFVLLCVHSFLLRREILMGVWQPSFLMLWYGVLAVGIGFGAAYPWIRLPRAARAIGVLAEGAEREDLNRAARQRRRKAGIVLYRRYLGILCGLFLCAIAAWIAAYRIGVSLYPWQVNLLTTGLVHEETEVTRGVVASLE